MKSTHRYSFLERELRKLFRKIFPIPPSPWIMGDVQDICAINLVPPKKLVIFFKDCIKLLRELKGKNIGDYLEYGVFNGNSMSSMYVAKELTTAWTMRLFGFDSFEGLPADSEKTDGGVWKKGSYACSLEQMQTCLSKRGVPLNEIHLVKGWYSETLNRDLIMQYGLVNFGIVFIDCDTYSSAKEVLDFIGPLISQPLIVCLDDWKLNNLDIKNQGEYRAFNEFLEKYPHIKAEEQMSYSRKSKTFLLRIIR